jgi:prepilin-type N-terminal cleavage/methylation domain-containing protein
MQPRQRGFSLVEMVMVMMTMGIIAMIAVPRLSRAATDAQASAMVANVRVLQGAIDVYAAEHGNRDPAHDPDGTVMSDGAKFAARLNGNTDDFGNSGGLFGPYLIRVPRNVANGRATIRVDGAAAGANLAGWRFDSKRKRILPDHLDEVTAEAIIVAKVRGFDAAVSDRVDGGAEAMVADAGGGK